MPQNDSLALRQEAFDLRSVLLEEFVYAVGPRLVRVCLDDYSMHARLAADMLGWEVVIVEDND